MENNFSSDGGRDGLGMVQVRYIYYVTADLTRGRAIIRAMGSGCKYRWRVTHSTSPPLTSCGADQFLTGTGTAQWPGVEIGDPEVWEALRTAPAAAAKSLQSCLTLCDPTDSSPPGSPVPGILQARTLKWVAISFSNGWKWKVKVKSLSCIWLLGTPWTAAYQVPPSMGFSRQEYWSGVPLPSPRTAPRAQQMLRKMLPPTTLWFHYTARPCSAMEI